MWETQIPTNDKSGTPCVISTLKETQENHRQLILLFSASWIKENICVFKIPQHCVCISLSWICWTTLRSLQLAYAAQAGFLPYSHFYLFGAGIARMDHRTWLTHRTLISCMLLMLENIWLIHHNDLRPKRVNKLKFKEESGDDKPPQTENFLLLGHSAHTKTNLGWIFINL